MKYVKLFGEYLRYYRRLLTGFAGCTALFALIFYLYRVPVQAAGYGALLCLCAGVLAAMWDFAGFCRRHRELGQLEGQPERSENLRKFPAPENLLEADYQRLVRTMDRELRELICETDNAANEREEYYTLWAHQIKTPIAALRLLLQTDGGINCAGAGTELLKIEQYVEMVLSYARLESGGNDFVFRTCSLDDIIRQAVRRSAGLFIAKRIELDYAGTDETVLTDDKWLLFVVEQILSNALKYTNQGKVSIYLQKNKQLVIEDTGIGIAPEDLPRVFERGYTGYNGRMDKKSTGIGLYLCRRVCDRLGHSLAVYSQPGVGTTVVIGLESLRLETAD